MEEQRIGFMYLNLFKRWLERVWGGMFPRGFRRSPALPALVVLLVIVLPIVAWRLHRAGRFGYIKREIQGAPQAGTVAGPRPGGMEPIVLTRNQTSGSTAPEFLSATLLPGLGMDVLQITAFLPNKGEVQLLAGPTAKDLADGTTSIRTGVNDRWGSIEVPWGGGVDGLLTPVGNTVRTTWRGKTIEAPTDIAGRATAEGGLLDTLGADSVETGDHSTAATATFKGTDFDQHWTSRNDVTVSVSVSARAIDLTVMVKNVGDNPEPMGIGWHPRFLIPSGNRDAVELRLPQGEQIEIPDLAKGIPSGRFATPGMSIGRFQGHPWPIGPESVDALLAHTKAGALDNNASIELRDPQSDFGLRMTSLTGNVRELRVTSPSGSDYVSLGMQTNYDDPFGKEWTTGDPAIVTLDPGQSVEWKVRLEIFSVANHATR